jgi:hypothetical protein
VDHEGSAHFLNANPLRYQSGGFSTTNELARHGISTHHRHCTGREVCATNGPFSWSQ